MRCHLPVAVVAFASITACTEHRIVQTSAQTPGAEPAVEGDRPTWLLGGYTRHDCHDGPLCSERLDLAADGSASRETYISSTVPYVPSETRSSKTTWSVLNDTFNLGSLTFRLSASPNCRLVQLDDAVFEHFSSDCPFEVAPLDSFEQKLVGIWVLDEKTRHEVARDGRLEVEDDRHVSFEMTPGYGYSQMQPVERTGYFTVKDGLMRATAPDGQRVLALKVERGIDFVRVCYEALCVDLVRKS